MNASNTAMSEFLLSLKDPPSWGALIHWGVLAGSRDLLQLSGCGFCPCDYKMGLCFLLITFFIFLFYDALIQ